MKPHLHLQSLIAVALCIIMAMALSGCSNDDEPANPKVEKRMMSIREVGRHINTFFYSDGKIVQEDYYYDYNEYPKFESSIKISYIESSIIKDETTYYLKNGLIYKLVYSDGDFQEFTYEKGRIKTWKKYYNEGQLDKDIVFEWKDGVIVRQIVYRFNDYTGLKELLCDYRYSYTNDRDYGGVIAAIQDNSLFYDYLPERLIIQGYFGKWPDYLVSEAVDESGYFEKPRPFTYILDPDGYPLVMTDGYHKFNFTWENTK